MDDGILRINSHEEWEAFLDSFGPLPPPHDFSTGPKGYIHAAMHTARLVFEGGVQVHQYVNPDLDLIWNSEHTKVIGVQISLRALRTAGLVPIDRLEQEGE